MSIVVIVFIVIFVAVIIPFVINTSLFNFGVFFVLFKVFLLFLLRLLLGFGLHLEHEVLLLHLFLNDCVFLIAGLLEYVRQQLV